GSIIRTVSPDLNYPVYHKKRGVIAAIFGKANWVSDGQIGRSTGPGVSPTYPYTEDPTCKSSTQIPRRKVFQLPGINRFHGSCQMRLPHFSIPYHNYFFQRSIIKAQYHINHRLVTYLNALLFETDKRKCQG